MPETAKLWRVGELIERPAALARTFGEVADRYEARPAYPAAVFEELVARCGLGAGVEVLEIGSGSGQATLPLLDHGAAVTVVDPSAALINRLRERAGDRRVAAIESTFEDAAVPPAAFDLVASATAFHWVDPVIGLAKCAEALRDEGWLALWWTFWGDPDRADPFHEALTPVLAAKAPELLPPPGASDRAQVADIDARAQLIPINGAFGPVHKTAIEWEGVHDPAELRAIFATFSNWIALPEPRRTGILDEIARLAVEEFGGVVRRPYLTVLYTAPRLDRPRHP